MQYRNFGRTNWKVSEVGYGMWGMAGWTGSESQEVNRALDKSIEMGLIQSSQPRYPECVK